MSSKEKEKARQLRKSQWWQAKLNKGICHYCGEKFSKEELTMDHMLPLARGGKSTKGNLVVACKTCNNEKKYLTPAELILQNHMKKEISF
jgi:5-methylcytosine-specific restriction protein A